MNTRSGLGFAFTLALTATVGEPSAALAQQSATKTVARFHVPDGWEVTLFASEPEITNPTAIDVDTKGRVWIAEGQWYRGAAKHPPADKIKVLEDRDGDGRCDRVTVFADGLIVPMSVCVAGRKVYVGESPNVWVFEDKDGDLRADAGSKKALITGFGGYNSDHGVHGLVLGPDDSLYMTNGDNGIDLTGADGERIKSEWGTLLRCNLDGRGLELLADNLRNPYELAVDSFGDIWCSDNDVDGRKAVRICWILEGGNYGWCGHPMEIRESDGGYDPANHWRAAIPGYVPFALITGFGSPCGMTFEESDAFGPAYRNQLFHADAGPRDIRCYHIEPFGAGFKASQETLLTSEDDYFRPDDVCVAPDGSIYISDWYDEVVGGNAYNNPDQGRIYRLAPKGRPLHRIGQAGPYENVADAAEALGNPNLATQFLAREKLVQAGQESVPPLLQLARGKDEVLRARALWVLDKLGVRQALEEALASHHPQLRALAVRILRRHSPRPLGLILTHVDDPDVEVRREVLLALRDQEVPEARRALLQLIRSWDGRDRFYLEAISIAAGGHGPGIFSELYDGQPAVFNERTVKLLQILKPPNTIDILVKHLHDADETAATASAIVDALSWMDDPRAARAVAAAAGNRKLPVDARRLAIRRIRGRVASDWNALSETQELKAGAAAALSEPDLRLETIGLIGDARIVSLAEPLIHMLADTPGNAVRSVCISALGNLNTPEARTALASQLRFSERDVQAAALKALLAARAFDDLAAVLVDPAFSESFKLDAVRRLAERVDGSFFLLSLIDGHKLSDPFKAEAIKLSGRHPDVNVRQLYAKYSQDQPQPATIAQLDSPKILALKGNAEHGRSLFAESAAKCTTCHRVGSQGNDVGPDLTLIGRKYGREALLDQIMRPAAAVAPEYVPYLIETASLGPVVGFVLQNTKDFVQVKTSDGTRETIPRKEVVSIQKQAGTLMPDLLLESYQAQDVADLVAYLASLKTAPQQVTQWRVAGPFPDNGPEDMDKIHPPEEQMRAPAKPGIDGSTAWRWVKPDIANGQYALDIRKLSPLQPTRAVFYLSTQIDSPQAQEAHFEVKNIAGIKVFLNGQLIHQGRQRRAAHTAFVRAPLVLGHNTLLVKIERTGSEAILAVQVEAPEPVQISLE